MESGIKGMNVIGVKNLDFIPCISFIPVKKVFETGSKSCPFSENQRPIALDLPKEVLRALAALREIWGT